jgi:hypothetical protein
LNCSARSPAAAHEATGRSNSTRQRGDVVTGPVLADASGYHG